MNKKILITGGAGFIGSQLAYRLYKDGDDITLIDNMSYGKDDNLVFPDVDLHQFLIVKDITSDLASLFEEKKFDYVYNIAGIAPLPDCQTNPCNAINTNVNGFVNVLENSRKFGVKTVIQASTNAMYERLTSNNQSEIHFNNGGQRILPRLIYPNTKYAAERFAQGYCDTYGMNVCCLRFANVYGPHIDCLRKQPPFVGYMIRELIFDRVPEFFSNGDQSRDYIYVDDLIELAVRAQNTNGFVQVNCSSDTSYSVKELYKIAADYLGKDIEAHYNDATHYWDKYPELFDGAYKIKDEILNDEVNKMTKCPNLLAYNEYDWKPIVSIQEGIGRCCDYIKKQFEK